MHRRFRWVCVVLGIFLVAAAVVSWPSFPPERIPLSDGKELRILKVNLGTNHVFSLEPSWKRGLRAILPEKWQQLLGTFQGQRFQTRHDSLVIWCQVWEPASGRIFNSWIAKLSAVLAGNQTAPEVNHRVRGDIVAVEFRCFARDVKYPSFQALRGTNIIQFSVRNPRPARAERWTAKPLPQTNRLVHTDIVLVQQPRSDFGRPVGSLRLRVRDAGGGPAGWMDWRATAIDALGNWSNVARGGYPLAISSDHLTLSRAHPWKLLVEGHEFLSAGFVSHPTNAGCIVLPIPPRAERLGVRFIMLTGAGSYRITNGNVTRTTTRIAATTPLLKFSQARAARNWSFDLEANAPGILCLWEPPLAAGPAWRARLRERVTRDRGRIFWPKESVAATTSIKGVELTAGFFVPRLPTVTTNLEVEIIASHNAEFIIEPFSH